MELPPYDNKQFSNGTDSNGSTNHVSPYPQSKVLSQTPSEEPSSDSWAEVASRFCEETSFHGFKQIGEDQSFLLRRLIWLLLLLAGTVIFFIQMTDSINHYKDYPVAVNIKINYNSTMIFPAVTICNHNAFRTTVAAEKGWYDLITDLFSHKGANLTQFNATYISLDELYHTAPHTKEDLIVSCEWGTGLCGPEDFVKTVTDYGVCYTFNSGQDGVIKKVTQTGTKGGLRLHLNIEQYEYMVGPNHGAGIHVLVHNPEDVPQVKDLGAAIPPGSHGYLGVQIIEVENLDPPHGKCDREKSVKLHDVYSIPNCADDCLTRKAIQSCKCQDIYMTGSAPICNLSSFQSCLQPAVASFNLAKECDCPVPCHRRLNDPVVSYASTSNFDMDKMLNSAYIKDVEKLFVKARETVQKVDKRIVQEDKLLITNFHKATMKLEERIDMIIERLHAGLRTARLYVKEELKDRVSFHKKEGVDSVHFITKHDFDRGWEIIGERTLPYVTGAFFGTIGTYERVIEKILATEIDCTEFRESTWFVSDLELSVKRQHAVRAIDNITEANVAYKTGKTLLTYKNSKDRRYDMSWVCLELLESSISEYQEEYYKDVKDNIESYIDSIDELLSVGRLVLRNQTFDKARYENASENFVKYAKAFNYRLFLFEDRVIRPPLKESESRVEQFIKDNATLETVFIEMLAQIQWIQQLIIRKEAASNTTWSMAEDSLAYLTDSSVSKTSLAYRMNSRQMKDAIEDMIVFFADIRARAINVHDQWYKIKNAISGIWKDMLADPCTRNFYQMVYDDVMAMMNTTTEEGREFYIEYFAELLGWSLSKTRNKTDAELLRLLNADFITIDITEKEAEIVNVMDQWLGDTDMTTILDDADVHFLKTLYDLQLSYAEFLERSKVDVDFYKENFLRLDVYMRELSYEEVVQEEAYSRTQLICDIGGSIGLFIGASFLSVFEIIDAVGHHLIKKCLGKSKQYNIKS